MLSTGFTIIARIARDHDVVFHPYSQKHEHAQRLLSAAQDDLQTVLMIGRLDYRDEPLQRIRRHVDERTWERCRTSDAALAQACYRTEGVDGLCRLEGDFALVCYDRTAQRLIALRDPMGAYPLFWTQQGETTALSTSIRPLVDLMPNLEINPEYTADFLSFPMEFIAEIPLSYTAYLGVQRVMPGQLWEANLSTRHVTCRTYWDWPEQIVPVAVNSVEAAGEQVRERLEAAVQTRLSRRAHTASHFSGGFDSTGVALLADRLCEPQSLPVHALSMVYQSEPMLEQEREYIDAALASSAGIVPHLIPADDLIDYEAYASVPLLDEPSSLGARWNCFSILARVAAEAGADTLMDGNGADHLFAHVGHSFIAERLGAGQVRQAWQLANQYSYMSSQSAWRLMTDAFKQVLPHRARDGIGSWLRGGRATSFATLNERSIPPWFTDAFSRRYDVRQRILTWQYPRSRYGFITADDLALAAGDWLNWYTAMPYGVAQTRPYFDPRVVTLGLGLPRALHTQPGRQKPVLAAALRGVLPEKIIHRSRKAHFGIFMNGMSRYQADLETLIEKVPIPDGILHREVLLEALDKSALGIYDHILGVGRLRMALGYLHWLSRRDAWRQRPVPTLPLQEVCHDATSK